MNYLIGESHYTDKEIDNLINLLSNAYFAMQEANGMVLQEMERILEVRGKAMRFTEKQKHGRIMQHIKALKVLIGDLYEDAPDVFNNDWQKWEYFREDASDVARICVYLYDRTEGDILKSRQIENFIAAMPEKNRGIDKIIDHLKIR